MLEPIVILETLEKNYPLIQASLGPEQWNGFCSRVGELTGQFESIAAGGEAAAAVDLEFAVNELLRVCWDYAAVADLLDRATGGETAAAPTGDGTRLPPAPAKAPRYNPKELANKYYSLLVKLGAGKPTRGGK